jgi:hypothetical protein
MMIMSDAIIWSITCNHIEQHQLRLTNLRLLDVLTKDLLNGTAHFK